MIRSSGRASGSQASSASKLRVGASGDYAPFSVASGSQIEGFDAEVARAYAADRGLELDLVRFAWPALLADLAAGRFDVAMSGVTVRPDRSAAGRYTAPVLETGAGRLLASDVATAASGRTRC